MTEEGNVGMVCQQHAPKPKPQYEKIEPKKFVGHFVKKAFPVRWPHNDRPTQEHMWVKVFGYYEGRLVGVLDNDPIMKTDLKCGDTVTVFRSEIEAFIEGKEDPEWLKRKMKKYLSTRPKPKKRSVKATSSRKGRTKI